MRTGRAGGRSSAPPLRTHCRPGGNTPAGQAGTAEAKTGLGPGPGVEPWLLTLPPEGGCRKTEGDCWDDAGGSWCDDWAAAAAAAADDDEEDLGGCCCRGAHCQGDYCRFGGALARGLALGRRSHCRATIGGAWCGWPGRKGRSLRGSWRAGCLCRTRCWFLSRLLSPADETGPRVNSQDLLFLLRLLKTSWNEEGSRQMWINNTWGGKKHYIIHVCFCLSHTDRWQQLPWSYAASLLPQLKSHSVHLNPQTYEVCWKVFTHIPGRCLPWAEPQISQRCSLWWAARRI